MLQKTSLLRPLAVAALFAVSGASQAAITVYTTLASFTAAVTNPGTDTFSNLSIVSSTPGPLNRTAGSYTYTVTTDPSATFFGAGTTANPWLSTNTATDSVIFSNFSSTVRGAGGLFFGSDIAGLFAAGSMTIAASDASGTTTRTITGATTTSFLGFVSTGALTSLVVTSVQPTTGFLWPTIDNFVLGAAAPIPEPETYALMLAGLGLVGFMARRRRA